MRPRCVIVGAGQCGLQAAEALRELGYPGQILMVGDEIHLPYQRPPLSKRIADPEFRPDDLWFRRADSLANTSIELRLGVKVTRIIRERRLLEFGDDSELAYDQLILATGARARRIGVPGATFGNVCYLRTLDDAMRLRAALQNARDIVVIGGGYIGLEVAALARESGAHVTVIESTARLLARVASPEFSGYVESVHRAHGVEVVCNAQVRCLEGESNVQAVCTSERRYRADLVVVGIGIIPNDDLANLAGLDCDDGIMVDESGRTGDPRIHAAGDCARTIHPFYGVPTRLESVHGAVESGRAVAASICGRAAVKKEVPWFWSHQFDLRIQTAGTCRGADAISLEGDIQSHSFAYRYHRRGRLIGVDAVNATRLYVAARKGIDPMQPVNGDDGRAFPAARTPQR